MTRRDDRKPKSREFSQEEQALGELLCAYLDDELNPTQRAEVEARIESDPTVRAQIDELTFAADALRTLPSGSAPVSILDDITARAERSELLGKPEESVTLARHRRGPFRSTMALAAMLMVAVSASLYVALQGKQNSAVQRQVAVNKPGERSTVKEELAKPKGREGLDAVVASRGGSSDRDAELKQSDGGLFKRAVTDLPSGEANDAQDESSVDSAANQLDMDPMGRISSTTASPALNAGDRNADEPGGVGGATNSIVSDEQLALLGKTGTTESTLDEPFMSEAKKGTSPAPTALGVEFEPPAKPEEPALDDPERGAPSGSFLAETMLASLDPEMTFEQKLVIGGGVDVLANHAFSNEPLQLVVAVNNEAEQAIVEERLQTFLVSNSVWYANDEVLDWDHANTNAFNAQPVDAERINVAEDELYYIGNSAQNSFAAVDSQQYLVRLQSGNFSQVVNDLTTIGVAEVQLAVGNMRSERPEEVYKLASQATGEPVPERSRARQLKNDRSRLQRGRATQKDGASDHPQSVPPTAQWLQALHSYGLLGQAAKEPQGRKAGGSTAQGKTDDATTNSLPDRLDDVSAPTDFAEIPYALPQRQELLTLVIELTNKSASKAPMKAKREPADKIESPKAKQ